MPEPLPIGPEVQFVVRRSLLIHDHVAAAQEVRERAARVRVEMIAREVRVLAMDGFSPRLAEVAAKNNLAVRFAELNAEVHAELGRLQDEFHRRVGRLLEDPEDASA